MKKDVKKYNLFKIVLIAILVTFVLTWIIPYGYFSGSELTSYGLGRLGISDLLLSGVYGFNFFLQQILFLVVIGVFYGILSRTSGYKECVKSIAKGFKNVEIVFVVLSSILTTLLTAFCTQTFIVLIFVPFIISVLREMKLDKITAFMCTFGSMLIGILGAVYGTEGLAYFVNYLNYYKTVEITAGIWFRVAALGIAIILSTIFNVLHVMKVLKANKADESKYEKIENVFIEEVEKEDKKKNKKTAFWPIILFFSILLIIIILGFVNWNTNFGITIFDKFHTWLTELSIGEYTIIKYILGNNAVAFGTWQIYSIFPILAIILVLSAIIYRVNLEDVIDGAIDGIKKMIKPILLLIGAYMIFVFIYWCPFTVTITNWLIKLSDNFNPFLTTIAAAVTSVFHIDFGYTGYVIGDLMSTHFGENFNLGFVIYTTVHGLVQFVAPTSVFLLLGLSYLNIPYTKWLKHIWKFALIMLYVLLVIFVLFTYVF